MNKWLLIIFPLNAFCFFFSLFDPCYARPALYFATLEGFLEASPQLVAQLSLLVAGKASGAAMDVVGFNKNVTNMTDDVVVVVFDREYQGGAKIDILIVSNIFMKINLHYFYICNYPLTLDLKRNWILLQI